MLLPARGAPTALDLQTLSVGPLMPFLEDVVGLWREVAPILQQTGVLGPAFGGGGTNLEPGPWGMPVGPGVGIGYGGGGFGPAPVSGGAAAGPGMTKAERHRQRLLASGHYRVASRRVGQWPVSLYRRMNLTNPRALRRALRRAKAFHRFAVRAGAVTTHYRRRAFGRKRR